MSAYSLELKGLTKQFGKTEIIRGVDLQVNVGERVAIIGPNGAGKSTLFNLISGRFAPSAGSISLNGQRIDVLDQMLRENPLIDQQALVRVGSQARLVLIRA
jgi:ABC-type branched-subunit amino acid transport system ATPase component